MVNFFQKGPVVIPIYQRNYDWGKGNCKKLLDDVLEIVADGPEDAGHFTGAIIYTNEGMSRIIIDGQQRLTTVQLLLLALRDSIKSGKMRSSDDMTLLKIMLFTGQKKNVLHPYGNDGKAFQKLYEGMWDDDWCMKEFGSTAMWQNYGYLLDQIVALDISAEDLLEAIEKLWVVFIELKERDDPQGVFESINTTGVKLSDSDRIRNFIMMNHSSEEQQIIYDEYWEKIEKYVGKDIEQFFFDYMRAITMTKVIASDHGVYNLFKKHHAELKIPGRIERESLGRIRQFAEIYHDMSVGDLSRYADPEASRAMTYINYLDQKVSYAFIMNVLYASTKGELSREEVTKTMLYLETFLERRLATRYSSNVLNGFLMPLFRVVSELPGDAPFPDKLAYVLASKRGGVEDPDDDQVREALLTRPLYKSRRLCAALLAIANRVNKDSSDVLRDIDKENGLTIDHILPQNPCRDWYNDIPDLDEIHEKYVDTIGNLTLTAYNSNFGNRSFTYRCNVEKFGYKCSPLPVNEYMKTCDVWDEEQILKRAKELIKSILHNRPIPPTNGYMPPSDVMQRVSFDDDSHSITGMDIQSFEFEGEQPVEVRSMKDCCIRILKRLCQDHPDEFTQWAFSENNGLRNRFGTTEKDGCVKLGSGLFINMSMSMSNHDKFNIIAQALKGLGLSSTTVSILYRQKESE